LRARKRRGQGLAAARTMMAEIFDGSFEFVDLEIVDQTAP
jgi:hypothetical protein